jgi:hypothetical protein
MRCNLLILSFPVNIPQIQLPNAGFLRKLWA